MAPLNLGIVYEPHPQELANLSDVLTEISGTPPEKEQILGYAGPNEVVQILVDASTWQNALSGLAMLFGGIFTASFAQELGKQAASEVWKEKKNYYDAVKRMSAAPFYRLVSAIQALRQKDQTVTISVKTPSTPRNASLVITSDDPAEIAWQISNVTRCAREIHDIIPQITDADPQSPLRNGNNPDMSIVIEVLESGDVKVLGVVIKK